MITWIQTILQKHHKGVFSVLLVAIIIAFVFTIGSSIPFFGDRNPEYDENKQVFYGYNLQNQNVVRNLRRGADYDFLLSGQQATSEEQLLRVMLSRAYFLAMANQLNIPTVSDEELLSFIEKQPAFINENGTFAPEKLSAFLAEASPAGQANIDAIIKESALIAKMQNIFAGAGYMQDAQVDMMYNLSNSKYTFSLAVLDMATFKPEISVNDAQIKEFFETNKLRYEVAKEISIKLAFFPAADFKTAENSDAEALKLAQEKAFDLLSKLHPIKEESKFDSDKVQAIIAESKVALKDVPSFKANATEAQFSKDYPVEILSASKLLDESNWLHNEFVSIDEGAYVVFLASTKPAYVPELTDIRIEVERDYKFAKTRELFNEKSKALENSLSAAIKDAKNFDETAKAEGAQIANFVDFSFSAPDMVQLRAMGSAISSINNLMTMKSGEISPVLNAPDSKAYIFYLSKLELPVLDKNSDSYKNFVKAAEQEAAQLFMAGLLNEKISAFFSQQAPQN